MKTSAQQKTLIESLRTWYRNAIRNSKYRWLVVLGSVLYLISPIDLAPDALPILGWIDDGLIATLLVTEVSQLLFEHISSSGKKRDEDTEEPVATESVIDVQAVSVH